MLNHKYICSVKKKEGSVEANSEFLYFKAGFSDIELHIAIKDILKFEITNAASSKVPLIRVSYKDSENTRQVILHFPKWDEQVAFGKLLEGLTTSATEVETPKVEVHGDPEKLHMCLNTYANKGALFTMVVKNLGLLSPNQFAQKFPEFIGDLNTDDEDNPKSGVNLHPIFPVSPIDSTHIRVTQQQVSVILEHFAPIREVYNRVVPNTLSSNEFWGRLLRSKYFYRQEGVEIPKAAKDDPLFDGIPCEDHSIKISSAFEQDFPNFALTTIDFSRDQEFTKAGMGTVAGRESQNPNDIDFSISHQAKKRKLMESDETTPLLTHKLNFESVRLAMNYDYFHGQPELYHKNPCAETPDESLVSYPPALLNVPRIETEGVCPEHLEQILSTPPSTPSISSVFKPVDKENDFAVGYILKGGKARENLKPQGSKLNPTLNEYIQDITVLLKLFWASPEADLGVSQALIKTAKAKLKETGKIKGNPLKHSRMKLQVNTASDYLTTLEGNC